MKQLEHPGLKMIIWGAIAQIASFIIKGAAGSILTLTGIILVVVGFLRVIREKKK